MVPVAAYLMVMSTPSTPEPIRPQEMPSRGTSTSTLERTQAEPDYRLDDGDHERFAHYVRKEKITSSAVTGEPVIALCGKVWVPGRDPNRFPVCPMCKEIYEGLRDPQDGGDNPKE
ncbi:Protein of uncharacterised function (DUF3039) [Dermatophilus congolensis]|uniref:Protein of uncharacterized function (DUF3039) n=2 Tax=Dermatophilus congolensis TaxID=1863 RepID=A0A239VJP9_9MICO|nr:Protein of uncharacterised function (DUF3039) [Dermatophilus congolensis]